MAALKHYYLGMAISHAGTGWMKQLFTIGRRRDEAALERYLAKKYGGEAILCKNGRSALCLALKAYFDKGDAVIVNGFTCHAVIEAVKEAGLKPVFADISKDDLNFTAESLQKVLKKSRSSHAESHATDSVGSSKTSDNSTEGTGTAVEATSGTPPKVPKNLHIRGIIVQNTLGNPADIKIVKKIAKQYNLVIIEDLAHCAGVRYDKRYEVGTVGVACALSFGKDKSIDTVAGGAVVLRDPCKHEIKAPSKKPKPSDHLRARFYPLFGALSRVLTHVGLGGGLMRILVKIHWVERSADSKLDLMRRPSRFEARLALGQFQELRRTGEPPLRDFYFVKDRAELLKKLQRKGYYFGGFWYEKPISPARYYQKVHFPEEECPNAVWVAEHIINMPNYYTRHDLVPARKIIKEYLEE